MNKEPQHPQTKTEKRDGSTKDHNDKPNSEIKRPQTAPPKPMDPQEVTTTSSE